MKLLYLIYQSDAALGSIGVGTRALVFGFIQVSGKVVEDHAPQVVDLPARFMPIIQRLRIQAYDFLALIPVFIICLLIVAAAVFLGNRIVLRTTWLSRFVKNPFLREIWTQTLRATLIVLAVVLSLELLGATALIGAVLGAAGVMGLAISFAFRDIIENYIAGILLSVRQPFRVMDHVSIDGVEGLVTRMTTRVTVIKAFEGSNIAIPNSTVFKQKIINFSEFPERRFEFEINIAAQFNPDLGRKLGIDAIRLVTGVMKHPGPHAVIAKISDATSLLQFFGWVDQGKHDIGQVKSAAMRAVKDAIQTLVAVHPAESPALTGAKAPEVTSAEVSEHCEHETNVIKAFAAQEVGTEENLLVGNVRDT